MAYSSFEELEVWKRSCRLAVRIYEILDGCRDFGLKDQMTRASGIGNRESGIGNRERGTGNGERGTGNGKGREAGSGKRFCRYLRQRNMYLTPYFFEGIL